MAGRILSKTASTRTLSLAISSGVNRWGSGVFAGSAILVGHSKAAARGVPLDIVVGAEHAGGATLNAILIRDHDLLLDLVPDVDARRTSGNAGLIGALQAAIRVHNLNMSPMTVFIPPQPQLTFHRH